MQDTKRSPVGKFEKMTWKKEELKPEVESYEDGKFVGWSKLAQTYNVLNSKGKLSKKWMPKCERMDKIGGCRY